MQRLFVFSFFVLCSFSFVAAQQTSSTPQNNQNNQKDTSNKSNTNNSTYREPTPQEIQSQELRSQQNAHAADLDNMLRSVKLIPQEVHNLYRKSKKEEKELLQPNQSDLTKHSKFLSQRKTGIVKLITDTGCADNSKVVLASEKCLTYSMPGAGSSFSFRVNDYRIKHLSDLTFIGNKLVAFGLLTQTLFIEIGDISIDEVNSTSAPVEFLESFQPESEFSSFTETYQKISTTGIQHNNFTYKREIEPLVNKTYALRSIAYNGKVSRSFEGESYDEFSFDQRKDVIIIFQIIAKESDQNITILWKELSRKNSPKLKNLPERID